ncbi:leucyl aminopeptidase family protein [Serratia quinivorans]|uniref:leucyl aminopeptidase family protein n=1 Tax=Serratia quinivorans TaxID=137545 RepID=UPI00107EC226|nr:leucyl aminopeptidase family protein [Serratia quinivorans]QBX64986.1 leucyl aminopeptidase family protein [Serratia quinivorans]
MQSIDIYRANGASERQQVILFAAAEDQLPATLQNAGLQQAAVGVLYPLGDSRFALNIGTPLTPAALQDAGAAIAAGQKDYGLQQLRLTLAPELPTDAENWRWLLFGLRLGAYRYQHHASATLTDPTLPLASQDAATQALCDWANLHAEGVIAGRELMNKPANILYPESFVEAVAQLPFRHLRQEVLGDEQMAELGFGGLLGVGQGSARTSQLLILDHHPANARHTLALVGKGVTFDSGGISIKGAARMSTMKFDMGGAAAVVGAMRIIDALQLPIRVIGLCGLVENMPSSRAQRPGDVVTMHNGKSVEIISTDAEGRMVLADVISYAQQRFQPDYLLDIATLTGGAGVALGKEYAAMMGNDEAFLAQVTQAGQVSAEPVWPMPHGGWYRGVLKSEFADYRHGGEDPHGSPCVAATFISEFVQPGQRWAHLDIAAMSTDMPHRKLYANGASSFGVLLLARLSSLLAETEH